jgi:transposase-like protein
VLKLNVECTIARQQIELEMLRDHLRQQASDYGDKLKGRAKLEADNQMLLAKWDIFLRTELSYKLSIG